MFIALQTDKISYEAMRNYQVGKILNLFQKYRSK